MHIPKCLLLGLALSGIFAPGRAQEATEGEAEDARRVRLPAVLRTARAAVEFPITCRTAETQAYFNQGVAALHTLDTAGADRAFYHAAQLEPECAMAWWGLAMANIENRTLGRHYLEKAAAHAGRLPEREQRWLAALQPYFRAAASEEDSRNHLVHAFGRIAAEEPENHEAAAFLARQVVSNRDAGLPALLPAAVDALIGRVLAARPAHPIVFYRLLLWEREQPQRSAAALEGALRLFPDSPRLHTLAGRVHLRLKQPKEAIAALATSLALARRALAAERGAPLELPGYVETVDLLATALRAEGRTDEALDLARHLIELPAVAEADEDPATPDMARMAATPRPAAPFASSNAEATATGQRHLLAALAEAGRWEELLAAAQSPYLVSTQPEIEARRLHARGLAHLAQRDAAALGAGHAALLQLQQTTRAAFAQHGRPAGRDALLALMASLARELEQGLAQLEGDAPAQPTPPARRPPGAGPRLAFDLAPPLAPRWELPDQEGRMLAPLPSRGRPVLLVFYRGAGCPHCIDQLRALAPLHAEFERAGITLYGVSTDTVEGLRESYSAVGAKTALPFQLVSDASLATFRAYGALDVRTRQALHGLFLLDGQGRILWQAIGAEPFMAVRSVLAEARRTLPLWAARPPALAHSAARP